MFNWSKETIEFENEDGSTIRLNKIKDQVFGEIDRQNTELYKFKKWRTWASFGADKYSQRLIQENPTMKDALWEYFFGYMGKESNIDNLRNIPLIPEFMGAVNLTLFLEKLELPLPEAIENESIYIRKGDRKYIKYPPNNEDLQKVGLHPMDQYAKMKYPNYVEDYIRKKEFEPEKKQNLFISIPTQNDKATNDDFIIYYKELLNQAYKLNDFRLLYDPYIRTNCFKCPFKGRTPAIEVIRFFNN